MEKKELVEIQALIDLAVDGQLPARNEFAKRLEALGFSRFQAHYFPHPTDEGKTVIIDVQDCYGNPHKENDFRGYWNVKVGWSVPHVCDDNCDFDCDIEEDDHFRLATAEEIVEVLRRELTKRLEEEEAELKRTWELAKALPTGEELNKIRRRVEDHLRKNPRDIPAVAKLLKMI